MDILGNNLTSSIFVIRIPSESFDIFIANGIHPVTSSSSGISAGLKKKKKNRKSKIKNFHKLRGFGASRAIYYIRLQRTLLKKRKENRARSTRF